MHEPGFILFYVEQPQASAAFYSKLWGQEPVENLPTFCLFVLNSGLKFGLWKQDSVLPVSHVSGGGSELALTLADNAAVDQMHAQWRENGIEIIQPPVALDFGYTFTAVDLDGHRLRVFSPF